MKFILVLFLVLVSGCSQAEDLRCESAREFKELIVGERYADLAASINFPVQVLIGGSHVTISDEVMLKALSKSIFTESFVASIKGADDCDLASALDIGKGYKVNSLVVSKNEEDLRYSRSGISSEKQLNKFIDDVNKHIETENYSSLSELFKYPFYIVMNDIKTKVETKEDFLKYQADIVSTSFLELIAHVSERRDFVPHANGLMLNNKG